MKDKKLIIGGIALIVLGVIVIVLYLNAHNNNDNLEFTTTRDVKTMINKVYKDAKVELPDLETNEIDIADSYQLSSFTGLENNNNIDFVVVSEPLINAQAYSLIVVKLKDKSNVEDIKKKMYDNIRMDKWICVSAEKLYITVRFYTHGLSCQIACKSITIDEKEIKVLINNIIEKLVE